MPLPDPPDLSRPRTRLLLAAVLLALFVGLVLGVSDGSQIGRSLGDTDDATRMYLVRSLLHGQGWWDQKITRLQPPLGVYMHWSRLIDGGVAGLDRLFALVLPGPAAEWTTRLVWPLLWIFPAAAAALLLSEDLALEPKARRRASLAPWICLLFLASNFALYIQFRPGRVDHHDVQMTLFLLAAAGACERRRPRLGGALAGVATGLGLAVGLEALLFDALIGAAIALSFLRDRGAAARLRSYGAALLLTVLAAFLAQTPPGRWGIAACDALAVNSTAAAALAGGGAALAAGLCERRGWVLRALGLSAVGVLVLGAYVGLDPRCLNGPFADVDPAIKSFWLVHVQEMRPWPIVLKQNVKDALTLGVPPLMGLLAAVWLARRRPVRADGAFQLCAVLLLAATAVGVNGVRMCGYADWLAMPLIAVAAADLADGLSLRWRREPVAAALLVGLILTPEMLTAGLVQAQGLLSRLPGARPPAKPKREPPDHCFDTAAYRVVAAAAPPGTVVGEIDLGPFVLANTQDSVLAAPYHRMSWGLIRARGVLSADADHGAEARARALGARYILECRAHALKSDRNGMGQNSLQRRLDRNEPPDWLVWATPPGAPVELYRIRPPVPAAHGS